MARLAFCDYHNMVAISEKSEHNVDFHLIVDFVEASHLRQNLKLNDEAGISSLPDAELLENLTLMGCNISPNQKFTFQKGSNIATALVCLATNRVYNFSKMIFDGMGEGSGTQTEPHHTPSLKAKQTSPTTHSSPTLPPVTTAPIPTVTLSDTPHLRQYTRRARIAQSLALLPVADEPASPLRDVSQDLLSKFEAQEFEITMLKARVKLLEDREGGAKKRSGDDGLIKGRSLDEGDEVAKKGSNDTEEMINVLTSMDATTVLSSRVAKVPTGSGSIPTAGPPAVGVPTGSDVVPTTGLIFATATMEYHQFATELPIERRIELISDLVRYQDNYTKVHKYQNQQRKPRTKKQQREFYTSVLRNQAGWKVKDFKGMTLEEIKENFDPVWKQIHDFIPIGSKEEAKRFKRKGIRFEQESVKKLKTSEEHLDREDLNHLWRLVKESLSIRPAASDKEMELWVELKRIYEPDDEDQLWTHTQNLMHAPVEWKLYDTCRVHHVTSKDKEIFMLVEKDYPLRKGLAIVMINYKL
nr:hypothetical protein [Tanacetum cinerariifolium]